MICRYTVNVHMCYMYMYHIIKTLHNSQVGGDIS